MADIEMNSIIKGGKQKETTNLVDKETKEDFCKCCIPENRCLCCFPKRSKCCKFCFLPFLILFSIFLGFLFVPRKVRSTRLPRPNQTPPNPTTPHLFFLIPIFPHFLFQLQNIFRSKLCSCKITSRTSTTILTTRFSPPPKFRSTL